MRRSTIPLSAVLVASLLGAQLPTATMAQDTTAPSIAPLGDRLEAAMVADAAAVGSLDGLREYVAQRIGYESYHGVLKGAVGTYLTGGGNGADQALLLDALIEAADPEVQTRFAVCAPDAGLAAALTDQAETTVAGRGLALEAVAEVRDAIDDPELRTAIDEVLLLRAEIGATADDAARRLADSLIEAGYAPPVTTETAAPAHVWLQADIDGDWVDLDPTVADGAARCVAEATHETLPETLAHVVRFSVTAERRTDGGLAETELLTTGTGYPLAELAASRVAFLFGEPAGLIEDVEPSSELAPYTPVLRIDGTSVSGEPIELARVRSGFAGGADDALGGVTGLFESLPTGDEEEAETADGGLGGLFGEPEPAETEAPADDLFGELGGGIFGGDEEAAGMADELTGLWLDIELEAPDGEVTARRTTLLDRVGFAARAAGDAETAPLEPMAELDGDYATTASVWQIGLLLGEVATAEAALVEPLDAASIDSLSALLDGLLRVFPAIRRDLGGASVYPTVLTARLAPGSDLDTDTVLTFDALHTPGVPAIDAWDAARDALSVISAERMLASLAGGAALGPGDNLAILERAWEDGTGLAYLTPGDTVDTISASQQALARIESRLAEGRSVLVPESPADFDGATATAWWLLDPVSGTVRDEHENGLHQEGAEYASGASRPLSTMDHFRRIGCRLARPVAGAALILFLATGAGAGSPLYEPLSEVVEAASAAREAEAGRKAAEQAACALG